MAIKSGSESEIMEVVVQRVRSTADTFSVYTASTGDKPFDRATIKQFAGPVREGQRWALAGNWAEDPKWGRQFVAQFAALAVPRNEEELQGFLFSGLVEGWAHRSTWRVFDRFPGNEALEVCANAPHRLLEVDGISEDMVKDLQVAWRRGAGMAATYAQLTDWGLKGKVCDNLIKRYGAGCIDSLTEDPYRDILEIERYGWQSAESIARAVGIGPRDPRRLTAGLECAIHERTWAAGHTWLPIDAGVASACDLLGVDYPTVRPVLAEALTRGHLVPEGTDVYPAALHEAECTIAAQIAQRLDRHALITPTEVAGMRKPQALSDDQWDAVLTALTTPISLLTGGPGVGKTTTLRFLCQKARQLGIAVTCLAPTGKAAARMAEATGVEATTIHSRLKIVPGVAGDPDDIEPVAGLVIVDEVSMLDTTLAAAMLERIGLGGQILMVGDPDQLPSVGPGAVLRDLLAADVLPRVHLDKVYRNEAGIAVNAKRIRDGETIVSLDDCQIGAAANPDHATDLIVYRLQSLLAGEYRREDILVLTPTNDGPSGRYTLNARLQPLLNPTPAGTGIVQRAGTSKDPSGESTAHAEEIRVGDRVMVTRNNSELGVFNGQTGTVLDVQVPRAIDVDIDGKVITFAGEDKRCVTLAYAITGHKSQGSEAKIVIAPIFPSRVLSREWLYTVLTRAKERCYLLGDEPAMQACLSVRRSHDRRTGLVARILAAANVDAGEGV